MKKWFAMLFPFVAFAGFGLVFFGSLIDKTEKWNGILDTVDSTSGWCGLTDPKRPGLDDDDVVDKNESLSVLLITKKFTALISPAACVEYADLIGEHVQIEGKRVECNQVRPNQNAFSPSNVACFGVDSLVEIGQLSATSLPSAQH